MTYPKPIMTTSEMLKIDGITRAMLDRARAAVGQTMAWKISPGRNATVFWSTEEFEKWRQKQCKLLTNSLHIEKLRR